MTAALGRHRPEDDEPDLEALAALADGRLDGLEREAVTAHLADCERCRTIVATLVVGAPASVPVWRSTMLPLAASLAIAVVGASAYWLARGTAPPPAPIATPTPPTPSIEAPRNPPTITAPGSGRAPATSQPERTRAAGKTVVAGKTFRLVAGEWIDAAYRETDFLPVVDVGSRDVLAAHPELRPYTELGSQFTVVLNGTVYRVTLPAR